jgi:hypothetical protein
MLDHVSITVSDIAAAALLRRDMHVLGIVKVGRRRRRQR